jgi:hypothetical protein
MRKSTSQSARALFALLLSSLACFAVTGTLLALFRPEPAPNVSQRSLTFAERVAYQRAIEDVYWRHRIWPKERPEPKPSLDSVMSHVRMILGQPLAVLRLAERLQRLFGPVAK